MRCAIKFGYDGTSFSGSQRQMKQKHVRTVEGDIISCLIKYKIIEDLRTAKLQIASRTDTGVSAIGNVIAFDIESRFRNKILSLLNSKVDDCWFYSLNNVAFDFKPRMAKSRWYRYYLFKDKTVEIDNIISISKLFEGTHDFRNFAKPGLEDTTRTMDSIVISNQEPWIIIDLKARGFLWNQVRRLVSAWLGYARKDFRKDELESALSNPDVRSDFGIAPAEPLVLMDVEYDFDFVYDHGGILKKTKERLEKKYEEQLIKNEFFSLLLKKFS